MNIKNPFSTTKSTFKGIPFSGVLNWVTVHSQIEKYVEIFSTYCAGKVKFARFFQIVLTGYPVEEWEILARARIFSSGGENLSSIDFDHSNLFQS